MNDAIIFLPLYVLGKKYGPLDFLACVLMSIGLTFFILADSKTQPSFNYLGMSVNYAERFFSVDLGILKKQGCLLCFISILCRGRVSDIPVS